MSDYLYFFLTLLLTETEMYVAAHLFSCRFDGRSNFALRVVLSCAGGVALTAIAALVVISALVCQIFLHCGDCILKAGHCQ